MLMVWLFVSPDHQPQYDIKCKYIRHDRHRNVSALPAICVEKPPINNAITDGQWCGTLIFPLLLAPKIYWTNSQVQVLETLIWRYFNVNVVCADYHVKERTKRQAGACVSTPVCDASFETKEYMSLKFDDGTLPSCQCVAVKNCKKTM